jgi:hypothetical protein
MEKRHLKGLSLLAFTWLVITGCGGIGKMNKYVENIKYTVDPNPLIVQGDSVAVKRQRELPRQVLLQEGPGGIDPHLDLYGW